MNGVELIEQELAYSFDPGDQWGSVMSALFDLCDAAWLAFGVRADGYEPSPLLTEEKLDELDIWNAIEEYVDNGEVTLDDILTVITKLEVERDRLVAAGLSY
jgi:hypothetical protein